MKTRTYKLEPYTFLPPNVVFNYTSTSTMATPPSDPKTGARRNSFATILFDQKDTRDAAAAQATHEKGAELGKGSYGSVYLMNPIPGSSGRPVAVKFIQHHPARPYSGFTDAQLVETVRERSQEIAGEADRNYRLRGLGASFCLQDTVTIEDEEKTGYQRIKPLLFAVAMEPIKGQRFAEFIQEHKLLSPQEFLRICIATLKDLKRTHAEFMHLDIHHGNAAIRKDDTKTEGFAVELFDFGLSQFKEGDLFKVSHLNLDIKPPEYAGKEKIAAHPSQDIHCVGRMLLELYKKNEAIFPPARADTCPCKAILNVMMEEDPSKRYTVDEAINACTVELESPALGKKEILEFKKAIKAELEADFTSDIDVKSKLSINKWCYFALLIEPRLDAKAMTAEKFRLIKDGLLASASAEQGLKTIEKLKEPSKALFSLLKKLDTPIKRLALLKSLDPKFIEQCIKLDSFVESLIVSDHAGEFLAYIAQLVDTKIISYDDAFLTHLHKSGQNSNVPDNNKKQICLFLFKAARNKHEQDFSQLHAIDKWCYAEGCLFELEKSAPSKEGLRLPFAGYESISREDIPHVWNNMTGADRLKKHITNTVTLMKSLLPLNEKNRLLLLQHLIKQDAVYYKNIMRSDLNTLLNSLTTADKLTLIQALFDKDEQIKQYLNLLQSRATELRLHAPMDKWCHAECIRQSVEGLKESKSDPHEFITQSLIQLDDEKGFDISGATRLAKACATDPKALITALKNLESLHDCTTFLQYLIQEKVVFPPDARLLLAHYAKTETTIGPLKKSIYAFLFENRQRELEEKFPNEDAIDKACYCEAYILMLREDRPFENLPRFPHAAYQNASGSKTLSELKNGAKQYGAERLADYIKDAASLATFLAKFKNENRFALLQFAMRHNNLKHVICDDLNSVANQLSDSEKVKLFALLFDPTLTLDVLPKILSNPKNYELILKHVHIKIIIDIILSDDFKKHIEAASVETLDEYCAFLFKISQLDEHSVEIKTALIKEALSAKRKVLEQKFSTSTDIDKWCHCEMAIHDLQESKTPEVALKNAVQNYQALNEEKIDNGAAKLENLVSLVSALTHLSEPKRIILLAHLLKANRSHFAPLIGRDFLTIANLFVDNKIKLIELLFFSDQKNIPLLLEVLKDDASKQLLINHLGVNRLIDESINHIQPQDRQDFLLLVFKDANRLDELFASQVDSKLRALQERFISGEAIAETFDKWCHYKSMFMHFSSLSSPSDKLTFATESSLKLADEKATFCKQGAEVLATHVKDIQTLIALLDSITAASYHQSVYRQLLWRYLIHSKEVGEHFATLSINDLPLLANLFATPSELLNVFFFGNGKFLFDAINNSKNHDILLKIHHTVIVDNLQAILKNQLTCEFLSKFVKLEKTPVESKKAICLFLFEAKHQKHDNAELLSHYISDTPALIKILNRLQQPTRLELLIHLMNQWCPHERALEKFTEEKYTEAKYPDTAKQQVKSCIENSNHALLRSGIALLKEQVTDVKSLMDSLQYISNKTHRADLLEYLLAEEPSHFIPIICQNLDKIFKLIPAEHQKESLRSKLYSKLNKINPSDALPLLKNLGKDFLQRVILDKHELFTIVNVMSDIDRRAFLHFLGKDFLLRYDFSNIRPNDLKKLFAYLGEGEISNAIFDKIASAILERKNNSFEKALDFVDATYEADQTLYNKFLIAFNHIYYKKRHADSRGEYFTIFASHSGTTKLSASTKLGRIFQGHKETFTQSEAEALDNGDLGQIFKRMLSVAKLENGARLPRPRSA